MNHLYTHLKTVAFLVAAGLGLFLAETAEAQTGRNVAVTNNQFTPKELTINAGDTVIWTCTQGVHNVNGNRGTFPNNPVSFGNSLGSGWTYKFVFTQEGTYNYHCDPHAEFGMTGKVTVNPAVEPNLLTLALMAMNPHVGQVLWISVKNSASGLEVWRQRLIAQQNQDILIDAVTVGDFYTIDFFADHNGSGHYDAPPVDHAWRITTGQITAGNNRVEFTHNTTFTDIKWKYKLTVDFKSMNPHVGQLFNFYLNNPTGTGYQDTVTVQEIAGPEFQLSSYEILPGNSYNLDFFADHNGNGVYDVPPVDHAWRIILDDVMGDVSLTFTHNTNFTHIFAGSSGSQAQVLSDGFRVYPNPMNDLLTVDLPRLSDSRTLLRVTNLAGITLFERTVQTLETHLSLSVSDIPPGVYFLTLDGDYGQLTKKIVKR